MPESPLPEGSRATFSLHFPLTLLTEQHKRGRQPPTFFLLTRVPAGITILHTALWALVFAAP
jgi:hypothetical protein